MGAVMGMDMNVAFTMADALGVNARAVAELLPAIEDGLVRGIASSRDDGSAAGADLVTFGDSAEG